MSHIEKVAIYGADSPSIDAFDRWRVSEPYTLFDSKQLWDKAPLFWDEDTTGSGSSVHSTANAATTMSVTGGTDSVIRQTFQRFNYQPGKSQLILMTGVMGSDANITRRIGAFDANNGLFFEDDGTDLKVVIRKATGDTEYTQDNWNKDTMDGNGPSKVTLDMSKVQIFVIDFEWLGVGRVRWGVVIDGIIHYVHEASQANAFTAVYTSTPNLPLRYEITSSGGAGDLVHICSTVMSEGGREDNGVLHCAQTGEDHVNANTIGTAYAVIGIRLKSTHLDSTIKVINMSMISETNDDFRWALHWNPTVDGTFTYNDKTNSCCQEAFGATANDITADGLILAAGYASTDTQAAAAALDNALTLGAAIDGTRDEIVLSVMPLSSNADIQAALNWRELL